MTISINKSSIIKVRNHECSFAVALDSSSTTRVNRINNEKREEQHFINIVMRRFYQQSQTLREQKLWMEITEVSRYLALRHYNIFTLMRISPFHLRTVMVAFFNEFNICYCINFASEDWNWIISNKTVKVGKKFF